MKDSTLISFDLFLEKKKILDWEKKWRLSDYVYLVRWCSLSDRCIWIEQEIISMTKIKISLHLFNENHTDCLFPILIFIYKEKIYRTYIFWIIVIFKYDIYFQYSFRKQESIFEVEIILKYWLVIWKNNWKKTFSCEDFIYIFHDYELAILEIKFQFCLISMIWK